MRHTLLLACVVALGCGSTTAGPCPRFHGVYQPVFTERPGGTCGPITAPDPTVIPPGASTLPPTPGCSGTRQLTSSCEFVDTEHCVGPTTTEDFDIHATVASTGMTAAGTDHEVYTGGPSPCDSTYDVVYTLVSRDIPDAGVD